MKLIPIWVVVVGIGKMLIIVSNQSINTDHLPMPRK